MSKNHHQEEETTISTSTASYKTLTEKYDFTKASNYLLDTTEINTSNPFEIKSLPKPKQSFKASDVWVEKLSKESNRKMPPSQMDYEQWNKLPFGLECSNHMIEIHWSQSNGWQRPRILPVHRFHIHPYSRVLNYAIEAFEGMKAYRGPDGKIRLFRPELNMIRLRLSTSRICLPDFDGQELIKLIKKLLVIDNEWIPPNKSYGSSLYIRPNIIGTDETLGVLPSSRCCLYVICGPTGSYFRPMLLLANNLNKSIRSWPGGSGDRKLGSNYAPTLATQQDAMEKGYHHVLWLFGDDQQLTEIGTMNIFVLIKQQSQQSENSTSTRLQLITPPLNDGIILPGITRQTIIELVKNSKLTFDDQQIQIDVVERKITIKEIELLSSDGRLMEIFGTGTAAILNPVELISYYDNQNNLQTIKLSSNNKNHHHNYEFCRKLYRELLDIQYGNKLAPFSNWIHIIDHNTNTMELDGNFHGKQQQTQPQPQPLPTPTASNFI